MFHPPGPHKKDDYCLALGTFGGFLRGGCCLEAFWGTSTVRSALGVWGISALTRAAGGASLPQWDLFPRGMAMLRACSAAGWDLGLLLLWIWDSLWQRLERFTLNKRCFVRVDQQRGERRGERLCKECFSLDKSWGLQGFQTMHGFIINPLLYRCAEKSSHVVSKKKGNVMRCNIPESLPAQVFFLIVCLRPGTLFCFSP